MQFTRVDWQRQHKFPLAKVGVEGSNPFARSKSPNP